MNKKDYAKLRAFTDQSAAVECAALDNMDELYELTDYYAGGASRGCINENALRVFESPLATREHKVRALALAISYYVNRARADDTLQVAQAIADATGKPYSLNAPA